MRIIQGLASAGSLVISRAVVSDLYKGHEMTKFFSVMMVINGLAPILSPIGGSLLLKFTDWRGIFLALTLIGIVLFIANFYFKESLSQSSRLKVPLLQTYSVFGKILRKKKFMLFIAIQTFTMGAMFAYIAASSFIFQDFYSLSPVSYSFCFATNGLGIVIGARLASLLNERKALKTGVFGILFASIFIAFMLCFKFEVTGVIIAFFLLLLFMGFILPTASSLAMNEGREYAGSASAVLGFCPFFLGGVVSPLVGLGDIFYSTSIVILACTLLAFASFTRLKRVA